uniref:Adenylate cyclase n=1 Tax=mine drainage metagenome TaxID=410659 RepID=E6QHP8_9ZZZZ
MVAIETEIKFAVRDQAALEAQLGTLGFRLITPRSFESNQLFDTAERSLRARRELVRIRNYAGRTILTHKRVPDSGVGEDRHKHRVESETEVTDAEVLVRVFAALGLEQVFVYEKWRAEWSDGEGHCVIDETPIGTYAELEGAPEWIDQIAAALGLDQQDRLTTSYGRLFDQWREQTGYTARDLTFADISGNR